MKRHVAVSLVLGISLLGIQAWAQESPQDFFKINYFANNVTGAPDATVRIDNPGSPFLTTVSAATKNTATNGDTNLCAMIYVFQDDQQLTECCGCLVTPNGLRTLSVSKDLTNNPLTGISTKPVDGVIKIVSAFPDDTANGACDPTVLYDPVPTVRAWASHIQNKVGAAYPITETPFTDATLSEAEFGGNLIEQCSFAQRLGSGKGICTCGTGD
jgi:hypothetical protein